MTSKVFQFLSESGGSNFTESAPRPPVYGEENELVSNGGVSTRSSGSHKSQLSNKSQTSSKSMGSNRGDNHSPAVTPRRSNKDKSLSMSVSCIDDDDMAPLGFEPEGSASSSPPFNENSTPSFMKWAENLNYLLEDLQGVEQFRKFLEQEGIGSYAVDFWFACLGLKKKNTDENITNVIRVIHKKYIKSDKLPCISESTKRDIHDKLQKRVNLNREIFDEAQTEVEHDMRNNTYPLFIKSDLYVQYVQKGGESPKSSNTSSGSITRPVSVGPLPTLLEDQELQTDCANLSNSVCGPPISGKSLNVSRTSQGEGSGAKKHTAEAFSSFPVPFAPRTPVPHPYHVSYAPVSAQDSEIQSLSSDALTDDTRSLPDSSVDNDKMWKRQRRAMRKRAEQNRESGIHQQFIPRTQRAPKDSNIAEVNPKKFADMLIEKLERVLKEREKEEKLKESMNRMFESDYDDMDRSVLNRSVDRSIDRSADRLDRSMDRSIDRSIDRSMDSRLDRSLDRSAMLRNTSAATSMPLMTSTVIMDDDNPNSILEEHVSRIWESSAQQTPTRSPGRQSPSLKRGADRKAVSNPNQTVPMPNTLPSSVHNKSFHKKRPDYHCSIDSGMGEDKPAVETHRHIHHHHHHHHSRDPKSKTYIEYEAQQHVSCWPGDANSNTRVHGSGNSETNNPDRGRTSTRRGTRKHSDTSSNIDSGISMIESVSPMAVPNALDPSTEKVLSWMRDNSWDSEHVGSGATGSTDTERTGGSHKRFRSAAASATPTPHKQGSTKKSGAHGSSRSASVERTGIMQPWMTMATGQAMPNQPFVQDPSMPLPTPPNTTVQLEEAKRRLEESHIVPVKSKSFTGVSSKEKKGGVFMSQSSSAVRPTLPTTRTVPSDLDLSAESTNQPEKKSSKKSSSSSANTSGSAPSGSGATAPTTGATPEGGEVIIGYFFCGEPIPYRHTVHGTSVTLAQFKHLIARRGNFKFFFKKLSNEFESEVVFEEIRDDNETLPLWDGKIVAKVEKVD